MPCYNVEKLLPRCMDSLVNQQLDGIEIIAVNDASPDRGIDILRRYEREYPDIVVVIDLERNLRQGGARNTGIRAATGKYIGFVDADDWVERTMYEKLYNIAEENNADIVACNAFRAVDTGNGGITVKPGVDTGALEGGEATKESREQFLTDGEVSVWNKIYRRDLLVDNGIWFIEPLFMEDVPWSIMTQLHAKSYYRLDERLYYHYNNVNSVVNAKNKDNNYDRLKILPMILAEAKKHGFYDEYKDSLEFAVIRHYYAFSPIVFKNSMDEIELDKLQQMSLYMQRNFPDYRRNPYFNKISPMQRVMMQLMDIDPELAFECLNIMR